MRSTLIRPIADFRAWRVPTLAASASLALASLALAALVLAALALIAPATSMAAQPDAGTPRVQQLSMGTDHACALATNGHAWCWGKGEPDDLSPAAEDTFRQVSASGKLHSCGVLTNGTVKCWGDDGDDQSSPPTDQFSQVSAGGRHSCGILADGTLRCWGNNDKDQATPPAGTFTWVSAGDSHTCAVAADRSVVCWGANESGQSTPPAGSFQTVSSGYAHTCGLQVDGITACWGFDDKGQIQAPTDRLLQVTAGDGHSCGLSETGRAICWGGDSFGESTAPAKEFVEVIAGYLTTCAITTAGTVQCWGYEPYEELLAMPPGPVGHWTLASGDRHSCATSSDSSVTCWGADDLGQDAAPAGSFRSVSAGSDSTCALGVDSTASCWGTPVQGAPPATPLRQIAVSDGHACAITSAGTLGCWGANDAGQATPPAGAFAAVTVGATHSCAIAANGSLACWGANDAGQATPPAGTFVALSAGTATTCAIAADGSLACWGANDAAQATPPAGRFVSVGVGDSYACAVASTGIPTCWGDTSMGRAVPTPKVLLSQIAAGGDHACGIASNGILVCWGANDVGQADPPVPGAPVLGDVIPVQIAVEDGQFTFQVPASTFTDTDPLTWTATLVDGTNLPQWLLFDPSTLTFSGTPGDEQVGTHAIAVIATDMVGLTGRTVFDLTVENTNDPPQPGNVIPDQDATEDATWTFVLPENAFIDPDLDSGDALTWNVLNGDGTTLPAWLRFDPATRTIEGTPSRDDIGQLGLLIKATDTAGQFVETGFNVRIARVNHPPTVAKAIPEQKALQDREFTFAFGRDTFKEQDQDDTLAYDAVQKDGTPLPSWLRFARSDRTFEGMPRDSDVGTLVVTVTAMDKLGATVSTDFALKVVNVNDPPSLISRIPDQSIDQDLPFTFTLSEDTFTDVDLDTGDSLTLRATGPDEAALPLWLDFDAETATFSGTPRDADAGKLLVSVTATDSIGEEAPASFTVNVKDVNDVPLVSQPTPDQLATVGQRFSLELTADMFTDADVGHGDENAISATLEDGSPLPGWLRFDPETLAFAGTPAAEHAGRLAISVVATDLAEARGVDTFFLDVVPERDTPTAPVVVIRRVSVADTGGLATIITWSAGREAVAGRAKYEIQTRVQSKGKWSKYKRLATATGRTGANKTLQPGTYQLRLRATPAGGKAGAWIEGTPFVLSLVQETADPVEYSGPWSKVSSGGAAGGTVRRSLKPGASATVTVTGETVGLIMSTGKGQGSIEACVDGQAGDPAACRTVDLGQGKKAGHNVVTVFRGLPPGEHTVVITVREGPVEFDGVIVQGTPAP